MCHCEAGAHRHPAMGSENVTLTCYVGVSGVQTWREAADSWLLLFFFFSLYLSAPQPWKKAIVIILWGWSFNFPTDSWESSACWQIFANSVSELDGPNHHFCFLFKEIRVCPSGRRLGTYCSVTHNHSFRFKVDFRTTNKVEEID